MPPYVRWLLCEFIVASLEDLLNVSLGEMCPSSFALCVLKLATRQIAYGLHGRGLDLAWLLPPCIFKPL